MKIGELRGELDKAGYNEGKIFSLKKPQLIDQIVLLTMVNKYQNIDYNNRRKKKKRLVLENNNQYLVPRRKKNKFRDKRHMNKDQAKKEVEKSLMQNMQDCLKNWRNQVNYIQQARQ